VHRFFKLLAQFRIRRSAEPEKLRLSLNQLLSTGGLDWHGVKLHQPDWAYCSHSLAFTVEAQGGRVLLHAIANAYWEPLEFELPPLDKGSYWRRWVDTSLAPPDDISEFSKAPAVKDKTYHVESRSVAVLFTPL